MSNMDLEESKPASDATELVVDNPEEKEEMEIEQKYTSMDDTVSMMEIQKEEEVEKLENEQEHSSEAANMCTEDMSTEEYVKKEEEQQQQQQELGAEDQAMAEIAGNVGREETVGPSFTNWYNLDKPTKDLIRIVRDFFLKKVYECKLCKKRMKCLRQMRKHIRIHRKNKSFVCNECGKAFLKRKKLAYHRRIHAESNRVRCPTCSRILFSEKQLKKHLSRHREDFLLKCYDCNVKFASRGYLLRHKCIGAKSFKALREEIYEKEIVVEKVKVMITDNRLANEERNDG